MKSPIIHITLYILLFAFSGHTQNAGIATLSSVLLEEKEDSLFVDMEIVVHSHSLHPYQSLTIIPELWATGDGISKQFPEVLINGKKRANIYKRSLIFNRKKNERPTPLVQLDINRKTDTTLVYRFSTPYQLWMDTASLKIHQILGACAGSEKRYTLENKARVKIEQLIPYEPQIKVNYITPILEPKHRNVEETAYLDFQVGQSVILPNFRRNPAELDKITQSVKHVQTDKDVTITGIKITGYASPDGGYKSNDRLSLARATALQIYISTNFGLPGKMFEVLNIAEDWKGFRELIEDYVIPDKEKIISIIDSPDDPDRKEQQLKTLGNTYRTLLNDVFPQLRRVVYQINYTVRDYSVEETEVLLQKNPEHLSPYEIFKVAERYDQQSEEWYMLMEKTVFLYPDDPIARINMAAALLNRGKYEEAGIYLQAVEADSRSYNNMGAYYLLAGEPDKAEFYLRQATLQNIEGTVHNLQEVRMLREDIEKRKKRNR